MDVVAESQSGAFDARRFEASFEISFNVSRSTETRPVR